MKKVYAVRRHNGTYEHNHKYVPADEAIEMALQGEKVLVLLVPDTWGTPGFIDWTPEEKEASEAFGYHRLLMLKEYSEESAEH